MKTAAPIGRRAAGLIAIALALTTAGCLTSGGNRYQAWQFQRAVEEVARTSQRAKSPGERAPAQARPTSAQPKTTDSGNESDDRHPSRWKRKLKAAYA